MSSIEHSHFNTVLQLKCECSIENMAQFDTEVNMLLVLGECRNNYREASNVFRQRYGVDKSHMAFHRLEIRVRTTGSVISRTRNRVKQIINEDNKVNILAAVNINPHISQRQLERESNISQTSIRRLLKTEKFHPYHLVLHQELLTTDYDQRIRFCAWMRRAIEENNNFFVNVLFSDESTFTNCGQVNDIIYIIGPRKIHTGCIQYHSNIAGR